MPALATGWLVPAGTWQCGKAAQHQGTQIRASSSSYVSSTSRQAACSRVRRPPLSPDIRLLLVACLLGICSTAAAAANDTTSLVQQQLAVVEVHAKTGQQLADAVAEWGATGSNMTIFIDVPYISMANVSFASYASIVARSSIKPPFSQGLLTITGQPSADNRPVTIFDAAMRHGLIPVPLTYPASYSVQHVVMINLYELVMPVYPNIAGPMTIGANSFIGGPSSVTLSYENQQMENAIIYERHADFSTQVYAAMLIASQFPQLKKWVIPEALIPMTDLSRLFWNFTTYSAWAPSFTWSFGVYTNITIKSLFTPNDVLLTNLRAQGKLMPPQLCTGPLLPQDILGGNIDPRMGPLRIVDGQASFLQQLELTAAQTAVQLKLRGLPAAIMLARNHYTVGYEPITLNLASSMLIYGEAKQAQPTTEFPWMDFQHRTDVFDVAPGAQVFIQWLVLTGLASQVPTRVPSGLSPSNLLPSVFPLAAFKTVAGPDTWHNSSSVLMHNTTLVIPPDDYLAFLYLAAKQAGQDASSCADAATIQRAAQLQAGFSRMKFSSAVADSIVEQSVLFDELQGLVVGTVCLSILLAAIAAAFILRNLRRGLKCNGAVTGPITQDVQKPSLAQATAGVQFHTVLGIPHPATNPLFVGFKSSASVHADRAVQTWPLLLGIQDMHVVQQQMLSSVAHINSEASVQQLLSSMVVNPDSEADIKQLRTSLSGIRQATPLDLRRSLPQRLYRSERLLSVDEVRGQVQQIADQLQRDGDKLVLAGVLGAGSGGTVFMGIWRGLQVAVKVITLHGQVTGWFELEANARAYSPEETKKLAREQRFIMEVAILATLGHPNIVALYHYDLKSLTLQPGVTQQSSGPGLQISMADNTKFQDHQVYKLFLVQELCHLSVATAMQDAMFYYAGTTILDQGSIVLVLRDVAKGLAYLHSKNIIHGDLKPENILLKLQPELPQGITAKLTDFGLSKKLVGGATHVSNWACGTPFYVAPEVVTTRRMSAASDMFSFGVVVWELFAQHRPFIANSSGQFEQHPDIPNMPPGCAAPPAECVHIIRCCLATDPKQRPSADEALTVMEHLLQMVYTQWGMANSSIETLQ